MRANQKRALAASTSERNVWKAAVSRKLTTVQAAGSITKLLLSPLSSRYRSLLRSFVHTISRNKKHIFRLKHNLCFGRTTGVWNNLRNDLRLRNLSVLSPLERIAHGCQLTKTSYIRTMVLPTHYTMLHECLTHIRASVLAAMLLYLLAIPELFVYFNYLFALSSSYRDVYLKWILLDTLYVGAMNL